MRELPVSTLRRATVNVLLQSAGVPRKAHAELPAAAMFRNVC